MPLHRPLYEKGSVSDEVALEQQWSIAEKRGADRRGRDEKKGGGEDEREGEGRRQREEEAAPSPLPTRSHCLCSHFPRHHQKLLLRKWRRGPPSLTKAINVEVLIHHHLQQAFPFFSRG